MSEWISVEKHVPVYGRRVILFDGSDMEVGQRETTDVEGEHFTLSSGEELEHVTHWRELPEAPPK